MNNNTKLSTRDGDLPVSLRKNKSEHEYVFHKKPADFFNEPKVKEWKHWFIVKNSYPYDMAFAVHDLLLPKREVPEPELNTEEKQELEKIIIELTDFYDCRLINYPVKQSIKKHFHIHLLKYKESRSDLKF